MDNMKDIKKITPTIEGSGYVIKTNKGTSYVAEYIGGIFFVGQSHYERQIGWKSSDSKEEIVMTWKYVHDHN
mgnify:CR=1 FL=1|tara:strand:- start:70882 stop:71097 length:216 start_codon:yes stop_codon:yes gene_type:complete